MPSSPPRAPFVVPLVAWLLGACAPAEAPPAERPRASQAARVEGRLAPSAPDAAPDAAPRPPLVERLGNHAGIGAIVGELLKNVAVDTRVQAVLARARGAKPDTVRRVVTEELLVAASRPGGYVASEGPAWPADLSVSPAQWDALVEDLDAALDAHAVAEADKREFVSSLAGLRQRLVRDRGRAAERPSDHDADARPPRRRTP